MAIVYSAVYGDLNYWDGTTEWGYDATSDRHSPTEHPNQTARDAQYTAAYTSLSAWEAARDGVSSGGDDEWAIVQSPWSSDDVTGFNIDGWAADTVNIRAIGDARHSGVWEDGSTAAYRLVDTPPVRGLIQTWESTTIDGIQFHNQEQDVAVSYCLEVNAAIGHKVSNCIFDGGDQGACFFMNAAAITIEIWNCVIYIGHTIDTGSDGIQSWNTSTCDIYNCTVYQFVNGIFRQAGTVTVKNCAVFGNTDDFNGTFSDIDYCASDDTDGTNSQDLNENASGEWTAAFTDYAAFDFSVKDSSSLLYDNGVADLFVDDDDIIGTSRPQGSAWDIGAFELIVAAGVANPWYQYAQEQ